MENREVLMNSDLTEPDQIDPEMHDLHQLSDEEYLSDDEFLFNCICICSISPFVSVMYGYEL